MQDDPYPHDVPIFREHFDTDPATIVQPCSSYNSRIELFRCLPHNLPPTCLPDRILKDFVRGARRGAPPTKLCATCPDIWLLYRPRPSVLSQCASVVLTDILSTFPDIMSLSEQVASFIFMYKLLQVGIPRNQECLVASTDSPVLVGVPPYRREL